MHKEDAPIVYAAAVKRSRGLALLIRNPRSIKPENPPKKCDRGRDDAVEGSSEKIPDMSGRMEPAALMASPPVNSSR